MLLLACPSCSRQYDVTGLDPGREVRCFCDEIFCVRWPDKLTGAALTCTNCGGAVHHGAESCPFCSAKISEEDRRKTTLCPECFTRIDDDSNHCRNCALEIHPQRLAPLPVGRNCPRCEGKLRVRSFGKVDVVECAGCLGMWLTPRTFQKVTADAEARAPGGDHRIAAPSKAVPVNSMQGFKYIPCLTCGELMNRRQYRHNGHISGTIIDACRGHGVWLDNKEIESIVEFISTARDRTSLPTERDRILSGNAAAMGSPLAPTSGGGSGTWFFGFADFVGSLLFGEL